MAERIRSKDGSRDTDDILGARGEVSQQGRQGGDVAREVATRDELKRATERPAGTTGPTKEQSRPDGNAHGSDDAKGR